MNNYNDYDDAVLRHADELEAIDEEVEAAARTLDNRDLVLMLLMAAVMREMVIANHMQGMCGCQN